MPNIHVPRDNVLFGIATVACAAFATLIVIGVPLEFASLTCAGAVVMVFLVRDRSAFEWRMIPLRLLAFVTGLFLVIQTIDRYGLGLLLGSVVGADAGTEGVARAAALGAILSNAVNNLPAYVASEAVVTNNDHFFGLLISTNVGPLVTPWASLAIILWYERCRSADVQIAWGRFVVTGAVTAVVTLVAAKGALLLNIG